VREKRRLPTWIRYALAGTPGYCLYYIVLYVLTEFAHIWYILSAIIGGVGNFIVNFLTQKYWTFQNKDRESIRNQAFKYALLFAGIGLGNLGGLYALTEWVGIWYMAAQLITSTALAVIGFYLTRKIFKQ